MSRITNLIAMVVVVGVLASVAMGAADLLLPGNLQRMGCLPPDTKYMFVAASQAGNVFYPGEAVDLTIRVTRGPQPLKRVSLTVIEIAMRQNEYLQGRSSSGMTAPPAVENLGIRGTKDFAVAIEDKPGATVEMVAAGLPVPDRYGAYAVLIAPNGGRAQFLCTLLRAHKPAAGFHVEAPVFGEGQFITHDSAKPEHVALRARTLGRLGIKGVRIELGWSSPRRGEYDWRRYDTYMDALAEAEVKALVTMGGHPSWSMPFGQPTPACIPQKPDHSCMPRYYDDFETWIYEFCKRYWKGGQGALFGIENWNEPWEGISISGWESDCRHYREIMKRIAAGARKVDPRIKTAAACSIMNTEDKFLAGDDREAMAALIDLFTDHYVPPRTSYGPMVAKFWGKQSTDTESWIAATEVLLPQVMCQFLACGQDRVTPWHPAMTYFSAPGSPIQYQMPNPVALATNVFNASITGKPFQRVLFLDHIPWGFQFGTGGEAVVVFFGRLMPLWGADVDASRDTIWWQLHLAKGGSIVVDNADGALELYDIAGNREFEGTRQIRLPADYLAHYIRCPKGGPAVIAERLRAARLEGIRPVEIIARDLTTPVDAKGAAVRVTLHNLLNRAIRGRLTVTPPAGVGLAGGGVDVRLEAGQTADLAIPIAGARPNAANAYPFAFALDSDAGHAEWKEVLHVVVAGKGSRKVDGRLDDWSDVPGVLVRAKIEKADATEQAWMPFVQARDKQPDGSFGEVKLAWDERFLYVAARVNDKSDYLGHQRLAAWDEDQYFRSAADDAVCETLRPYEKFVRADMRNADVAARMKADPRYAEYEKFLADHPESRQAVATNAARVYLEARKRDPKATFADAAHVYKKVPWNDAPFAGDVLQFGLDVLEDYYHNMKPDTDRVPRGFHAMPDTDYEYSAYACADGGAELWRLLAPGLPRSHHYPRQPRAKFDQGPVSGGQCAVKREGTVTTYELAIPWAEMKEWKQPRAGQTFGFTFIIRNNDGPALIFGADKSATKTNGLSLHPYWAGKPSCGVRWALGD